MIATAIYRLLCHYLINVVYNGEAGICVAEDRVVSAGGDLHPYPMAHFESV